MTGPFLLENWVREIRKFCPDFSALKHQGALRTGRPGDLEGFDVIVASYDTAIRDLSLLKMIEWNVVILDEAQNIRNPDALRTRSVKQIPRKVGLAVTGTPVENRLRDLWSIMDFVVPDYRGDLNSFEARYGEDMDAAAALEPMISPLMLRRRVAEVASDLPDRIDIPEVLELSEAEAAAYNAMREAIFEEYGAAATLVSLGKLRQFSAHTGPAVLVLNPRAGGSGLNITASNHVIHYNPEWNPALEDQASARAHRRGQERPVTIRRLIYAGTVEEVISERLQRKRGIANAAVVGVEGKEDDYADIMAALQRSPFSAGAEQA